MFQRPCRGSQRAFLLCMPRLRIVNAARRHAATTFPGNTLSIHKLSSASSSLSNSTCHLTLLEKLLENRLYPLRHLFKTATPRQSRQALHPTFRNLSNKLLRKPSLFLVNHQTVPSILLPPKWTRNARYGVGCPKYSRLCRNHLVKFQYPPCLRIMSLPNQSNILQVLAPKFLSDA